MPHQPLRILVVDDDPDARENLRDILTDRGDLVDVAGSAEEALPLLTRAVFDVALADFKMPGMDGLALCREIRQLRAASEAVIVSAYADDDALEQATQSGAVKFLHKPVDLDRLLSLIDRVARQPLIMLVDDDHNLCANLWDILHECGYRLDVAHTEADVVRLLQTREYGVALIDLKLPSGDGGGVLRRIRESNPAAHAIVITGYRADLRALVDRVVAEGADAVCDKPLEIPELLRLIGRLAAPEESHA